MKSLITVVLLAKLCFDSTTSSSQPSKPNIIVVLIDDLDWVLGGMEPMAITRRLINSKRGAIFTNAFVSTPVCCPSRSSILTGKYVHNHGVINNTVTGNCSSPQWQNGEEKKTMATYLQNNGYTTFYGGKYLNQYGKQEAGGVEHVPPGYDRFVGLVGNSRYYNYSLSVDGIRRDHGDNYRSDYLTDVLAKEALDFIGGILQSPTRVRLSNSTAAPPSPMSPFFAMIAPPACHSPWEAAPQFASRFAGRKAPRWPNFNRHPGRKEKHWLVRQAPPGPLPRNIIQRVDHVFRQRWRTLLSVDYMIGKIAKLLSKAGQLDKTNFLITSDHGYHMGQFAMPVDKRLPYETDIRVPLLIRTSAAAATAAAAGGNGGEKATEWNTTTDFAAAAAAEMVESLAVVSIDLAPTVLDMAGIDVPQDMDGVSLLKIIGNSKVNNKSQELKKVATTSKKKKKKKIRTSIATDPWNRANITAADAAADAEDDDIQVEDEAYHPNNAWRTSFLIEYHGEYDIQDVDPQCQQDTNTTLCLNDFGCKCQDAANNTYVCVRTLSPAPATAAVTAGLKLSEKIATAAGGENSLYCHFADQENFIEFYDLKRDPYEMKNKAVRMSAGTGTNCVRSERHLKLLSQLIDCKGRADCFRPPANTNPLIN